VTENIARLYPEPEPQPAPAPAPEPQHLFRLRDIAVGSRLLYACLTTEVTERWRVVAILRADGYRWHRMAGVVARHQCDRVELVDERGQRLDRAAGTLAWTSYWRLLP
jgi:hypothetical protein